MSANADSNRHDSPVAEQAKDRPAPKVAAVVNDVLVPMPCTSVKVAVLREQGSVPSHHALYRDHDSDHDPRLPDNGLVDLTEGNVFYSDDPCDRGNVMAHGPAKLAYVVDDRWLEVIKPAQTGRTLRDLFALAEDVELLRDLVSPDDTVIGPDDSATFALGWIFRTQRRRAQLEITVNKLRFTEKDGVKRRMTGREIAALVEPDPSQTKVQEITPQGPKDIPLNQEVVIENCEAFKVIRCNINAGFQAERLEREVAALRDRGANVTVIGSPPVAIIYHDVPVRSGFKVTSTDVLVRVPSGYPGGIIDNAFLPAESPLLSCTPGAEQHVESFGGRSWKQKSIHPYTGNVPWNKDRHGFHTYYAEMVSWLHAGG
jgi:hypothetical protein